MIANNIKKFRKEFGLTQGELGGLAGMDPKSAQQRVARLEDGAEAKIETAFRISEVLGQRVENVFPGLKKYSKDSNTEAANNDRLSDNAHDAEGNSPIFLSHPAFQSVKKDAIQIREAITAFEKTANEYSSLIKPSHCIPMKLVECQDDALSKEEQPTWFRYGRREFEIYKKKNNIALNGSTYGEPPKICEDDAEIDVRSGIDFFHNRKTQIPEGARFAAVLALYTTLTWMRDNEKRPHLCMEFTTVYAVEHIEETLSDINNARMVDYYYGVTSNDDKYKHLTTSTERVHIDDCDFQTKKLVVKKYLAKMADLMMLESGEYHDKTRVSF